MTQPFTPRSPSAIYVWLVPSEEVLEQPGSWRIRKWDIEPFPEANYTLAASSERKPRDLLQIIVDYHRLASKDFDAKYPSHANALMEDIVNEAERLLA